MDPGGSLTRFDRILVAAAGAAWVARVAVQAGAPAALLTAVLWTAAGLASVAALRRLSAWLDSPRLVLVLLALWTLPDVAGWVGGDGYQYYVLLRSPLFDHDLAFDNDFLGLGARPVLTTAGVATSRMPIGCALAWAPPVAVTHAVVRVAAALGAPLAADGFSPAYQATVTTSSYLYVVLALALLEAYLRRHYGRGLALLVVLGIWLATPLQYYVTAVPSMSHAAQAAFATFFVLAWLRARESVGARGWALAGALGGMVLAIRPQDAVLLLLPAADLVLPGRPGRRAALAFAVGPLAFGLLQVAVWLRMYGIDFAGVISGQSYVGHTGPEVLALLFSARHGLFPWTPLYAVAVAGFVGLYRHRPRLSWLFALVFVLAATVNGAMQDWWGSDSFGQRRMLGLTPLFALGLAEAARFLRRHPMLPAYALLAALAFWNDQLAYIYGTEMIAAHTEALPLDLVAAEQARTLWRRVSRWESWLPRRAWFFAYEGLQGTWIDEGARSLRGRVDLGDEPDTRPPLLGPGWYKNADGEGAGRWRRSRGDHSALRLPVRTPGDFVGTLRLRSEMQGVPVRVSVEWNGERLLEAPVPDDWGELAFEVPARLVRPGFNDLVLAWSTTPRQARGGGGGPDAAAAVDELRLVRQGQPSGPV